MWGAKQKETEYKLQMSCETKAFISLCDTIDKKNYIYYLGGGGGHLKNFLIFFQKMK